MGLDKKKNIHHSDAKIFVMDLCNVFVKYYLVLSRYDTTPPLK